MRVGTVVKIVDDKKFGFIRSPGLHDDVFFHFAQLEKPPQWPLREGDELEFEIDELARIEKRPLRAIRVRLPEKPLSRKLVNSDAPELHAQHHPRARRRRPAWRQKPGKGGSDPADSE
ncbi:MAG: cold shock domain-containing protein [Planctomycetota bacterium]|nr:MAG: cold shock domain-containing protein [Planctomycetota bacterium]